MKKIIHPAVIFVAALVAAAFPVTGRAQVVIGTGPDVVNLAIQAPAFGEDPLWYEYRYDAASFTDPTRPLNGWDVLLAVVGDSQSKLQLNPGGSTDSGFANALAYNGGAPVTSDFVQNLYWTYFAAGGAVNEVDEFFSPRVDGDGIPIVKSIPVGAWSLSPVGGLLRYPSSGSWDGLVFGKWEVNPVTSNFEYAGPQPGIAPVPEPSGAALLLGGAILVVLRWFHKGSSGHVRA